MMSQAVSPLPFPCEDAARIELLVLDFDGVLTDNTVWVNQNGEEMVRCWRSDGLGLNQLKALELPVWVLSTEVNPVVARRCEKLKLPCRHGLEDKCGALRTLADELGISLEKVAFVGNDINDLQCLQSVGVPIVVQDAYPLAKAAAKYQTEKPGGFGAVREVCDWLVACRTSEAYVDNVESMKSV